MQNPKLFKVTERTQAIPDETHPELIAGYDLRTYYIVADDSEGPNGWVDMVNLETVSEVVQVAEGSALKDIFTALGEYYASEPAPEPIQIDNEDLQF